MIPKHYRPFAKRARYKVAYGGRGSGKSWAFAEMAVEVARRSTTTIICTREYQRNITDSVHKLLSSTIKRLGYKHEFEITKDHIIHKATGTNFIFFGLKNDPEKIKSYEDASVCWVEEAARVTEEAWDTLIPTIRAKGSEIWVSFNPGNILDETYQRFVVDPPKNCVSLEANYYHNPYFPDELRQEMEACKERDYQLYLHIWEGKPLADAEHAVIPPLWLEAVRDAHLKLDFEAVGKTTVGLDVADEGKDANACIVMKGSIVQAIDTWTKGDVITTADRALHIAQDHRADTIVYDSIGVGAGVKAHYARHTSRICAVGFNAGARVDRPDQFYTDGKRNRDMFSNLKAQAWWHFRDRVYKTYRAITNGDQYAPSELISIPSDLPNVDYLCAELSRPKQDVDSAGRVKVESKADMKKRGIPSPNLADAMIMAAYGLERPLNTFDLL